MDWRQRHLALEAHDEPEIWPLQPRGECVHNAQRLGTARFQSHSRLKLQPSLWDGALRPIALAVARTNIGD